MFGVCRGYDAIFGLEVCEFEGFSSYTSGAVPESKPGDSIM